MSSQHDIAFGVAAVKQRKLTSEQVNLGTKSQKVLAELGINKSLAVIAVEAGWMELDVALTLVTGLRKLGVDHPEVRPREASDADEAVLDRLGAPARKRLEAASRTLASLFYARGAGALALDQGSPTPVARPPRKVADPTPTPAPALRLKPQVVVAAPPPRKSGALGAILASLAAVAAIVALILTRKSPPKPEPEPPPVVVKKPEAPPKTPPAPPKETPPPPPPVETEPDSNPPDSATDPAVEARRKLYIEQQEKDAAKLFGEVKVLIETKMPSSARQKIKQLLSGYGWTEFVKLRKDEIARLMKEAEEGGVTAATDEPPDPGPMPGVEEPPLPAMAAALKRLDDGAAADARRAVAARKILAGAKFDLALRGGKIFKGAEVVDVSREDLRVRGEIGGAKVDLLLTWNALEPASFLPIQKQASKGQGAAGLFELGRACLQRRLWKEAKAAFDECGKLDAAWKPRLPDIAAVMADPSVLRGAARRLGDGRLLVEYSFTDAEQAADFSPGASAGTATVAGGALKLAGKETALFSWKDVVFSGDVDVYFQFEGPGEAAVGFGPPGEGQKAALFFGDTLRLDLPNAPPLAPASAGVPVKIERRGAGLRIRQGERVLGTATIPGGAGPRKLYFGARGEAAIKDLWIAGVAEEAEMARRVGPLERLEGGAHSGDFRLEPVAAVAESNARAALAEAALDAGLHEEAWTLAEEAVSKAPAGGLAIVIRGLIRLAQGEMRLAVADADLALALEPCRGDVIVRARRILASLRGPAALGAYRRLEVGPWDLRTDASEERLNFFAGKLEEAAKRFAEALKEAGSAPRGIRAAVFSSRDALFLHLETSDGRDAAVVDGPGAEAELVRLAARAYVRAAAPASPGWFEEGMAAHLAGENRAAEMKELLAQAAPLDALIKKSAAEFTETDRIQSTSFVRFLLAGAHKGIIPDLLNKLRHGVPAIEAFSGKSVPKLDAEWRAWAATDAGK